MSVMLDITSWVITQIWCKSIRVRANRDHGRIVPNMLLRKQILIQDMGITLL